MSPSKVEPSSLSFKRLHDTFAVEVEGVDWSQKPLPDNVISDIKTAINREGVLVFRNANLNNEEHISFTQQLNEELYDVKAHIKAGRPMRFPEQPEIFDGQYPRRGWHELHQNRLEQTLTLSLRPS